MKVDPEAIGDHPERPMQHYGLLSGYVPDLYRRPDGACGRQAADPAAVKH